MVALGTRAYLGLVENEELVPGHCRIVPIQHHFSSLDADDETWDEIKVSHRLSTPSRNIRLTLTSFVEFYEDLDADVCCSRSWSRFLRILY